MLGSSFNNLVVAGMKHLEYRDVWNFKSEKKNLLTLKRTSRDSPGMEQVGKYKMERMHKVIKYLYKSIHSELIKQRCCKTKIWN